MLFIVVVYLLSTLLLVFLSHSTFAHFTEAPFFCIPIIRVIQMHCMIEGFHERTSFGEPWGKLPGVEVSLKSWLAALPVLASPRQGCEVGSCRMSFSSGAQWKSTLKRRMMGIRLPGPRRFGRWSAEMADFSWLWKTSSSSVFREWNIRFDFVIDNLSCSGRRALHKIYEPGVNIPWGGP